MNIGHLGAHVIYMCMRLRHGVRAWPFSSVQEITKTPGPQHMSGGNANTLCGNQCICHACCIGETMVCGKGFEVAGVKVLQIWLALG
jgi:hypothetical protein